MVVACLVAAGVSACAIGILRQHAAQLGLVDRPNERKLHHGEIPLVGGLAIFIGILAGAFAYGSFPAFTQILLGSAAVIVLLGVADDRFDLSVRVRVLVQSIVILAVIASTGVYIHTLGHLFGHDLELGWLGVPFTVVAIIGLLNAFNLMDGIDGLAGSLTLVSIAAIVLFAGATPLRGSLVLIGLIAAATLPYLAANLGRMSHKIFMGDAGSMVLGYLLAWTLIRLSQEPGTHLSPVDVLWCVALPVMDTLRVMFGRWRQGISPFKPGRGHIHHILMRAGLGSRATLVTLIALAAAMALTGSVTVSLHLGSGSNLATFCGLLVVYSTVVNRVWALQRAQRPSFTGHCAANDGAANVTLLPLHTPRQPAVESPAKRQAVK